MVLMEGFIYKHVGVIISPFYEHLTVPLSHAHKQYIKEEIFTPSRVGMPRIMKLSEKLMLVFQRN